MNPSLGPRTVSGTFHFGFAHEYQRMISFTVGSWMTSYDLDVPSWMTSYDLDVPSWTSEPLLSMADGGVRISRPPERTAFSLTDTASQPNPENSGKDRYSGALVSRAAPTNDGCVPQQTLNVSC
jgi:hypothetical protein